MDDSPRDPLLLAFFATLGLGADVRSLARGGWKLVILIGLFVAVMILQGVVGLAMARALDLHPLVGLLGASISLIGGHGTAAAYATSFAETRNLQGALELGMAAATAGLILGSLLAGPVAERVMRRAGGGSAGAGQCRPRGAATGGRAGADHSRAAAVRAAGLPRLHRRGAVPPGAHARHGPAAAELPVGAADRHAGPQRRRPARAQGRQRQRRAGGRQRLAVAVPDHGTDVHAGARSRHAGRAAAADRGRQRLGDGGLRVFRHCRG